MARAVGIRTHVVLTHTSFGDSRHRPLGDARIYGGRSGIRTHGTFQFATFPRWCHRPLGHSSIGVSEEVRSLNLRNHNPLLYQLSYTHHRCPAIYKGLTG